MRTKTNMRGEEEEEEAPGSPRTPQEAPADPRKPQEALGGSTRPQEATEDSRRPQDEDKHCEEVSGQKIGAALEYVAQHAHHRIAYVTYIVLLELLSGFVDPSSSEVCVPPPFFPSFPCYPHLTPSPISFPSIFFASHPLNPPPSSFTNTFFLSPTLLLLTLVPSLLPS